MYRIGSRYVTRPRRLGAATRSSKGSLSLAASARFLSCLAPSIQTTKTPPTRASHSSNVTSNAAQRHGSRRYLATAPETQEKQKPGRQIAVLGGGLTGMATAWHLAQMCPKDKITLYEASDRLGGWIQSEKMKVKTLDGKPDYVCFEKAARMIAQPRGSSSVNLLVFYEMIHELDLEQELVAMSAEADSDFKKYIYYPDHLAEIPSLGGKSGMEMFWQLWRNLMLLRQPVLKGLLLSVYHWRATTKTRKPVSDDISLGQYCSDALGAGGPRLVNNLMSAMIHGIWGGDIWKITAKRGPFGHEAFPKKPGHTTLSNEESDLVLSYMHKGKYGGIWALVIQYKDAKTLWFRRGFHTLTNTLWQSLERMPNVTILKNQRVDSIRTHSTGLLAITANGHYTPPLFDRVVSTLTAKTLASLADNKLPSLANTHAVTIQLVSLWYPTPNINAPYHGVGYLLPQGLEPSKNPEGVLGVLFDSAREAMSPDGAGPGTKFTVLMGGHLWDEMPADLWPSDEAVIEMAKTAVARHLNLTPEQTAGVRASAKVCRECIPQHYVGHWRRMVAARDELQHGFGGRLSVAGGSYQMPGVLGSIRAGRDIARFLSGAYTNDIAKKLETVESPVGNTGLDRFDSKPRYTAWRTDMLRKGPIERNAEGKPKVPASMQSAEDANSTPKVPASTRSAKQRRKDRVDTIGQIAMFVIGIYVFFPEPWTENWLSGKKREALKRETQARGEKENRGRLEGGSRDPTGQVAVESDDPFP